MKKRDTDHCRVCGSEDLFDGFFDLDELGSDGHKDGDRWRTSCNSCGAFQDTPRKKVAR